MNKFPVAFALKGAFFIGVFLLICTHVGYTVTESVPFRFYIHYPANKLKLYKYYVFKHSDRKYDGMAVKKLVCMPGQTVTRDGDSLYCDGVFIVDIEYTVDSLGKPLQHYNGEELKDKAFFIGDNPRSYDSRYFGGVPVTTIKREVMPVW